SPARPREYLCYRASRHGDAASPNPARQTISGHLASLTSPQLRATATFIDPCTGAPGANLLLDVDRGRSAGAHVLRRCSTARVGKGAPGGRPVPPVYSDWLAKQMNRTGWAKAAKRPRVCASLWTGN